jgi:AraC-like DNA-binding protein
MGTDSFAPVRFSTTDLRERDRVPIWRETFSRAALKLDIAPHDDTSFHAELTMLALPGLGISWGHNSRQRAERTRELIAGGDDDLCLIIGQKGDAALQQMGREAQLGAGDALMVSGAEVGIADCSDGFSHFTLKLPRRALASRITDVDGAVMRPPVDSSALKLLLAYLRVARDDPAFITPELGHLAATHIYDLVAVAMGATRDAAELARMRGVRAARMRSILEQIKSRFADPSFSPRTVATKLQVSPRYVQELLQETGASFTERVLEMRLQKARSMLMSPVAHPSAVGEIAYACGFNEVSYFNRRFRRRFGVSPTQYRANGHAP